MFITFEPTFTYNNGSSFDFQCFIIFVTPYYEACTHLQTWSGDKAEKEILREWGLKKVK